MDKMAHLTENKTHLSKEIIATKHIRMPDRDPHGAPLHLLQRHHKLQQDLSSLRFQTKLNAQGSGTTSQT
jgi:hypothetical protein